MAESVSEAVFPAQRSEIPNILRFVSELAKAAGIHPKRVAHLELAVEEAVMNIASYAYPIPPGDVTVRVEWIGDRLVTSLIDDGVPFDPLKVDAPDLHAGAEERPVGGLGIFLLRRIMDEVHYERHDGHNVLMLVIRANSPMPR
jgi:anti-sigma regulatory factor (Ser/Thr protein kinase)